MIHEISLADCLEVYAPPKSVLTLGALNDTVFVRICTVDQDHKSETLHEQADISVSLPSLIEALQVLLNDQGRENLRPAEDGSATEKETRLAGRRIDVLPVGFNGAVGALTEHLSYSRQRKPGNASQTVQGADSQGTPGSAQ